MTYENKTYDELKVGESATLKRVCTAKDIYVFANSSGNLNPIHFPDKDGDGDGKPESVMPSMWIGSLVSSLLGNILPGPGTLYRSQTFTFHERAHVGDELVVTATVREKKKDNVVVLDTEVRGRGNDIILEGVAEVLAPVRKVYMDEEEVPELLVHRHQHFNRLFEESAPLEPLVTAVVAPEEKNALGGALLAASRGLITPVLIGATDVIKKTAKEIGADLSGIEIIDQADHSTAAAHAVELVNQGKAEALMKGHLHTDELLHHVVKHDGGLRTSRLLSHCFVFDVPGMNHILIVTDAAINIAPDLEAKVDITQNAIELAQSLGVEKPKAGILSAVETVNPKIPSTLDAAILAKMADRGQITGGIVDGPLAMDNALSVEAAKTKGITSLVAGKAEILVVPNLEAGNMLAKELMFIAHADGAGIVLGAKVPIILTSRADNDKARLASCAVAVHYNAWKKGMKKGQLSSAKAAE